MRFRHAQRANDNRQLQSIAALAEVNIACWGPKRDPKGKRCSLQSRIAEAIRV